MIHVVNLGHVPFPIVFAWKGLAAGSGKVASGNRAVELLLLLVPVVDVALKMRLGAKALATIWIWALVVLAVVALMMPGQSSASLFTVTKPTQYILELVGLVKFLIAASFVTSKYARPGDWDDGLRRNAVSKVRAVEGFWAGGVDLS